MAKGSPHLTDEDITRVRILHRDAGEKVLEICRITGYTKQQVRRAITPVQGPRQRKGPPPAIGPAEEALLIQFVTASPRARYLSYKKVSQEFLDGAYGEKAVRNALTRLGYTRSRI